MTALPTRREATPSEMRPTSLKAIGHLTREIATNIECFNGELGAIAVNLTALAALANDLGADLTQVNQGLENLRVRMADVERQCENNRKMLCSNAS